MDDVRWHARPALHRPMLVAAFTGWNDAGDSASSAVRTLIEGWDARPLATIDPEEYTDFATTRPHVKLADGLTREIVWPTVKGMAARGMPYKGVLYAGLMITADGPKLIEYNARFGDPETQVMMLRLMSDLVPALQASRDGQLKAFDLRW